MFALKTHLPDVSRLVLGCMGFGGGWDNSAITAELLQQAASAVDAALEHGINFFDHADIYTLGKAEQTFGHYLKNAAVKRDKLFIQTKCAIRFADDNYPGRYDFSAGYIIASVEQSLTRLQTDYIDVLLLHRPDPLMQPDEVASAFDRLHQQGKVRHFGVSNMGWAQMQLLQDAVQQPLVANQLQMSLADLDWLEEGVLTGMRTGAERHFGYGTVEYCMRQHIQLQSWGSMAQGMFSGGTVKQPHQQATAELVRRLAQQYQCSTEAIVLAWLMRHPAGIQPIIGTTKAERIAACAQAATVTLSREDWYSLYVSARGQALP